MLSTAQTKLTIVSLVCVSGNMGTGGNGKDEVKDKDVGVKTNIDGRP